MAQRKRAGSIAQRTKDRNLPLLSYNRIVVSTSRCGRDNPGSNPGYSNLFLRSARKKVATQYRKIVYLRYEKHYRVQTNAVFQRSYHFLQMLSPGGNYDPVLTDCELPVHHNISFPPFCTLSIVYIAHGFLFCFNKKHVTNFIHKTNFILRFPIRQADYACCYLHYISIFFLID